MVRSERARNIILPYCEVAAKRGTPEELAARFTLTFYFCFAVAGASRLLDATLSFKASKLRRGLLLFSSSSCSPSSPSSSSRIAARDVSCLVTLYLCTIRDLTRSPKPSGLPAEQA